MVNNLITNMKHQLVCHNKNCKKKFISDRKNGILCKGNKSKVMFKRMC